MKYPLSGIFVLDFTRLLPGPFCTQMLAELGATVIKVEHPSGDPSRESPPFIEDVSVYFHSVNRGKKSIVLDLKKKEGQKIAHRLIEKADILVENFKVGGTKKLALDYATARAKNPSLIYCSITGFGRDNAFSHLGAHDLNIQGLSGCLGEKEPSFLAGDYSPALMATVAILSALLQRQKTQKGTFLDISMWDSLLSMQNIRFSSATAKKAGETGEPKIEVWGENPRYAIYSTKDDKKVSVSLLETHYWQLFCEEIGRLDLFNKDEKPEMRHSDHGHSRKSYRDAIASYCASRTQKALTEKMHELGVPIFPILSPEEVLEHKTLKSPLHKLSQNLTESPKLGEHTEEILKDLGI